MNTDGKKLFLIDAYALIYRAYYALMRSPRVTSTGLNTSAIFGFCNTLTEVLKKENPDYIAVCFDPAGGHTFRHDAYPEYKAQRDKQPEDITLAVPYIKEILAGYRIPVIEVPGYEADDVVGTLARKAEAAGFTTYMMTPDKDYGQLVTDKIFMYRPSGAGQGFEIRGPQEICERYGIERPEQVIDLLALEGDASDNVPGCPGVGEKTASKLIGQYGSVENLIAHVDELKGALQKKVSENIKQIEFSKFLVTIKTDVPVDIDLESLRRQDPDNKVLVDLFNQLEFKTFIAKINAESKPASAQGSLFDDFDEPSEISDNTETSLQSCGDISITENIDDIKILVQSALEATELGVSIELDSDDVMTANIRGIAIAIGNRAEYIAMPDFESERKEFLNLIAPVFTTKSATIVSHDIKRLMLALRRNAIEWNSEYFDTSVAHYLISPESKHDITTVAQALLRYRMADYELTERERKTLQTTSVEDAAKLCGERALVALLLKPELIAQLEKESLLNLYHEIEAPFIPVLASMEWEGVRVNVGELREISNKLTERLSGMEQQVFDLAGMTFNINSPAQVGEVLFGHLKIDSSAKKTKRGAWSTTEEVLEKYAPTQPIVRLILDIRGLRKLLTTYVDALPSLINPRTGKIHTTYNQIVTATGRISSANPNLQNIPIRTDDGREIRRAFIPDEGDLMMSADYSQIELRLMADISGDKDMIDAFNAGADIHRATAAKIFHEPIDKVTDDQRRKAKTANFGIIYGISAFGLSNRLDIPRSEAKELIDNYMSTYSRVRDYMKDIVEQARNDGYVSTIFGRKRFLPDINSRNSVVRSYAERNAINAPLQGSAADIIKIAMVRIDAEMRRRNMHSRMIMQVHDELVFNVKQNELDELRKLVIETMSGAYHGKVALEVSCGEGQNWLEAH